MRKLYCAGSFKESPFVPPSQHSSLPEPFVLTEQFPPTLALSNVANYQPCYSQPASANGSDSPILWKISSWRRLQVIILALGPQLEFHEEVENGKEKVEGVMGKGMYQQSQNYGHHQAIETPPF